MVCMNNSLAYLAAIGMAFQLVVAGVLFEKMHLRWTGIFVISIAPLILMDVFMDGDQTIIRQTFFLFWSSAVMLRAIYLHGLDHAEIKRRRDHKHYKR